MNFIELKEAVAAKSKIISAKENIIAKHREERRALLEQCTHDETVDKSEYSGGGYDYRSQTVTWEQCTLCGYRTNIRTQYGGFQ